MNRFEIQKNIYGEWEVTSGEERFVCSEPILRYRGRVVGVFSDPQTEWYLSKGLIDNIPIKRYFVKKEKYFKIRKLDKENPIKLIPKKTIVDIEKIEDGQILHLLNSVRKSNIKK